MLTYGKALIERAKREGLHLFRFDLNGYHARRASISVAMALTNERADYIAKLWSQWVQEDHAPKAASKRRKRK